jgi:hypothetical protein
LFSSFSSDLLLTLLLSITRQKCFEEDHLRFSLQVMNVAAKLPMLPLQVGLLLLHFHHYCSLLLSLGAIKLHGINTWRWHSHQERKVEPWQSAVSTLSSPFTTPHPSANWWVVLVTYFPVHLFYTFL